MNACDPKVAELIGLFSVGGITLRIIVAQLKDLMKVKGILALVLTFVLCAAGVVAYMAITGWAWPCFLFWTSLVFVGTQAAYRASHK